MRINKYLADCGVASRRMSEKLVTEGHVKINGKVVRSVNIAVQPTDRVQVDDKTVLPVLKQYYIMMHKPKGYVTTAKDELDRKTVFELVKIKARLFSIGRLDYDTEGLLLLTNDGSLTNILTHPKYSIDKTYVARISGQLTEAERLQLEKGVTIDGRVTAPAKVNVLLGDVHHTRVEIIIHEGRNHQVKKMFEAVGKQVEFLKRTAIGQLRLGGLSRGEYRDLTAKEINYLKSLGN